MKTVLAVCAVLAAAASIQATENEVAQKTFFRNVPGPSATSPEGISLRIYGGNEASRKQFPYQAGVYINFSSFCGGSLISKRWVLTAGHCVDGGTNWAVFLGVSNMLSSKQEGREVFLSNKGIRHEDYDADLIINDIAVILLYREVKLSEYISFVKLAPPGVNYAGNMATISGFGKVDDNNPSAISPVLKYTSMPVVSNSVCGKAYGGGEAHYSYLCLEAQGTSSCEGDSGGPLVVKDEDGEVIQIGLTSFGASRGCTKGYPVGFTRVNYFLDWLTEKTGVNFP